MTTPKDILDNHDFNYRITMLEMKIEELQNLLTEEVNEESSEDKLIDIYQDLRKFYGIKV